MSYFELSQEYPQREPLQLPISRNISNLSWDSSVAKIALAVLFLFCFALLSLVVFLLTDVHSIREDLFKGLSFNGKISPANEDYEIWRIPCTNGTIGSLSRETFTGLTTIEYNCPKSEDACKNMVCFSNGTCGLVFKESSFNCSISSDCETGMNCVGCICTFQQPCSTDEQCGEVPWTDCLENRCIDGFCVQNFTEGSECVTEESCGTGFRCRDCECMPGDNDACISDSDCGIVEWSECFSNFCELGTCFSRLTNTSTCVTDGECRSMLGENFQCTNCTCTEVFPCKIDSDCGSETWSECLESKCVDGFCNTNFTSGSECASNEKCPPGFECQNCTCQATEDRCEISSDCPSLNYTTCIVNECIDTFCVPVLENGNECADSSLCSDGEYCNQLCQCESLPAGFIEVQNGIFTVGGATTFNCEFRVYSQGILRILFVATPGRGCTGTASTNSEINSVGAVLSAGNRPSDIVTFSVPVVNDGSSSQIPSLGTLFVRADGSLSWFVGGSATFTSGNFAGVRQTSVTYSTEIG